MTGLRRPITLVLVLSTPVVLIPDLFHTVFYVAIVLITKYYTWFKKLYDIEPNTLIYASNEFKVTYRKIILIYIDTIFIIINIFSIIETGHLARFVSIVLI